MDLEGTDKTDCLPIEQGAIWGSTRKIQVLESRDAHKLVAFLSKSHRGNLCCGSEFPVYSCKPVVSSTSLLPLSSRCLPVVHCGQYAAVRY
jgi:hypothetical protein